MHPRPPLDDGSHPRQGPQVGAKPVRARPLAQRPVDDLQLLTIELRFAARSARPAQGAHPALPPFSVPATHALAADREGPSDRGQNLTGPEQRGGLLAPIFQRLKISSRTNPWWHAPRIHQVQAPVTLFCEIH